jgi:hypothetical protein
VVFDGPRKVRGLHKRRGACVVVGSGAALVDRAGSDGGADGIVGGEELAMLEGGARVIGPPEEFVVISLVGAEGAVVLVTWLCTPWSPQSRPTMAKPMGSSIGCVAR